MKVPKRRWSNAENQEKAYSNNNNFVFAFIRIKTNGHLLQVKAGKFRYKCSIGRLSGASFLKGQSRMGSSSVR
jgi:hypothetical protein